MNKCNKRVLFKTKKKQTYLQDKTNYESTKTVSTYTKFFKIRKTINQIELSF